MTPATLNSVTGILTSIQTHRPFHDRGCHLQNLVGFTIKLGSGNDILAIRSTAAGMSTGVQGGLGNDTVTIVLRPHNAHCPRQQSPGNPGRDRAGWRLGFNTVIVDDTSDSTDRNRHAYLHATHRSGHECACQLHQHLGAAHPTRLRRQSIHHRQQHRHHHRTIVSDLGFDAITLGTGNLAPIAGPVVIGGFGRPSVYC